MLADLMRRGGRVQIASANIALTSGTYSGVVSGADTRHYGYYPGPALGGGFGSRSPTSTSGYTINDVRELLTFNTSDGTYGTLLNRKVIFELTGGAVELDQFAFTSIRCPTGSQLLLATDALFTVPIGAAGQWIWTVTTGTDDGAADYLGSGTVQLTG